MRREQHRAALARCRRARPRRARHGSARRDPRAARRAKEARIAASAIASDDAASLTLREPAMGDARDTCQSEPLECGVGLASRMAGARGREVEVLAHREIVVAERLMTHERQRRPDRAPVDAPDRRRALRPHRSAGAAVPRRAAKGGLACTVAPHRNTISPDCTSRSAPASAGKSTEHANGRPKVNDTQKDCSGTGER